MSQNSICSITRRRHAAARMRTHARATPRQSSRNNYILFILETHPNINYNSIMQSQTTVCRIMCCDNISRLVYLSQPPPAFGVWSDNRSVCPRASPPALCAAYQCHLVKRISLCRPPLLVVFPSFFLLLFFKASSPSLRARIIFFFFLPKSRI